MVFAKYSGLLRQLQLASHELAAIWQKIDEKLKFLVYKSLHSARSLGFESRSRKSLFFYFHELWVIHVRLFFQIIYEQIHNNNTFINKNIYNTSTIPFSFVNSQFCCHTCCRFMPPICTKTSHYSTGGL